ncbi:MAG: site-specific integrase [Acidobacteria bacterium]|nr:site-specific integrase [Acidobacteriota bacterium]
MGVIAVEMPRGSGKWWVRIRWQIPSGKRWRKTKLIGTGDAGRDAASERAKLLNEAWAKFGPDAIRLIEPETPQKDSAPIPTVSEYARLFMKRMESAGLKRSTLAMYRVNLDRHIIPALGNLLLPEISYRILADFLSEKSVSTYSTARFRRPLKNKEKEKRRPKGHARRYSRDTIRIMTMTLRSLMSEAVRDGIIPMNPVAGLSRFYRKKKKDREVKRSDVYTAEELHSVEDQIAVRHPEYFEFALAMSREGMRIGEACALTVHDIDWARGTILINKNIPSGTGELEDSAKTDASDREMEFWSVDFRRALEAMLKRRRVEWLARGEPAPEALFCERSGHTVNYSRFLRAWNGAQKSAGVRQRSPHSLRHTWASQMIAAGEDIGSVSRHLGHANPGVTLSIYTHFLPKKRRLEGTILDRQKASGGQMEAILDEGEFHNFRK